MNHDCFNLFLFSLPEGEEIDGEDEEEGEDDEDGEGKLSFVI